MSTSLDHGRPLIYRWVEKWKSPKANLSGGPFPFLKGIYLRGGKKKQPKSYVPVFHELPLFPDGFP